MLSEKPRIGSNNFVKNDPFASTIIGLVVLILLLGGVLKCCLKQYDTLNTEKQS